MTVLLILCTDECNTHEDVKNLLDLVCVIKGGILSRINIALG